MTTSRFLVLGAEYMNEREEKFGTTFKVDGQWYLRLEGFGGVLFPLVFASSGTTLKDGISVKLTGHISLNHQGFPDSIYASHIEQIGLKE